MLVFCFIKNKAKGLFILFLRMQWSDGKSMALGSGPGLGSAKGESQLISFLPVSQQLNGDSDSCCPEQ